MGPITSLPGFVNAHTHSPYGPHYSGVSGTSAFEEYILDITLRQEADYTPDELAAFALVTGLENLSAGNTAIIDQCYLQLTAEHVYAVARTYEQLNLRAWVFTELSDLPFAIYTREAYPKYPQALPLRELPAEIQNLCTGIPDYRDQLSKVESILRGWYGSSVKIGIGLSNPVWCSDQMLRGAASLAAELNVPLAMHIEESPVQHRAHLAQWGMSMVQRIEALGLLSTRALLAHAVQIDEQDISIMAKYGCSVAHNPTSNLKLHNGIAPVGSMLHAGINVCLGSDGSSSGDSQSLFPPLEFVSALAFWNGIAELNEKPESIAMRMATENGRHLWFEGDLSADRMEFTAPIGPYGPIWDNPESKIKEVYIAGSPCLDKARQLVTESGANRLVAAHMERLTSPETQIRVAEIVRKIPGET
jgi:5-methylthioadenosine/S-adenosylhomocysteine deaminase